MKLAPLFALATISTLALAGCAAEASSPAEADDVIPDDATAESAVVVRRCPERLAFAISDVDIFRRVPTDDGGYHEFDADERKELGEAMAAAREVTSVVADLPLRSTSTGRCVYSKGQDEPGPYVVFYTQGGRDLLQIDTGTFRLYARVTSYSKDEGITIASGRRKLFFSLPIPGPYAEDARTVVHIGWASIAQ